MDLNIGNLQKEDSFANKGLADGFRLCFEREAPLEIRNSNIVELKGEVYHCCACFSHEEVSPGIDG